MKIIFYIFTSNKKRVTLAEYWNILNVEIENFP